MYVTVTMSDTEAPCSSQAGVWAEAVQLTEADIPGAFLTDPIDRHTMPQLRWWLLCRGVKVPTSWKKQQLVARYVKCVLVPRCVYSAVPSSSKLLLCCRIQQAKSEQLPVVDVDGSYLYRK